MVELNPTILIIIFNINALNIEINNKFQNKKGSVHQEDTTIFNVHHLINMFNIASGTCNYY